VIGYYPAQSAPEIAFAAVIEGGEYSADMAAQGITAYNTLKAQRSGQQAGNPASPDSSDPSSSGE